VRVIVQFIDDNSRTLHVLLVFDLLYDKFSSKEARILGLWWPTETVCFTCVETHDPILSTSDQARLPAEFKHINKRWKRNQTGYP
jgi:hypothetical protein